MKVRPDAALVAQYAPHADDHGAAGSLRKTPPGLALGLLTALLPALLMLLNALSEMLLDKGSALLHLAAFVGNPIVAMLLGVVRLAAHGATPRALLKNVRMNRHWPTPATADAGLPFA